MTQAYEREKVLKIIDSVLDKVKISKDPVPSDDINLDAIRTDLMDLHHIIEELRHEVGVTMPSEITGKHIPAATDELDAVVDATAEASSTIMDSCESIENLLSNLPSESADPIGAAVTRIYEACSFQDITGQRISKVVRTLKVIDTKVESLLNILGRPLPEDYDAPVREISSDPIDPESLLNGPQLPSNAISQEEIDKILADFG